MLIDKFGKKVPSTFLTSVRKAEMLKNSTIKPTRCKILQVSHLVRYADYFVFTTIEKSYLNNGIRRIKSFLAARGLSIDEEKSRTLK